MSDSSSVARVRPPMILLHGGNAVVATSMGLLAAAEHAGGNNNGAIIAGCFALAVAVIGPLVTQMMSRRGRRNDTSAQTIGQEKTDLIEHQAGEIHRLTTERDDLQAELARLRRRR